MQADKDYYSILGVESAATQDEIRRAYRELVRRYHPDANPDQQTAFLFREVQEAYEVLSDPDKREAYNRVAVQKVGGKQSALSLRTLASHKVIRALKDQQAFYVLTDITPAADLPHKRLPVNVCLVLDKSTSMQGMRLQNVKEATRQIIDLLQPDDTFSLVAFSDRAEVMIPGQRGMDKAMAKSITSTLQPGGGTEMLQGVLLGVRELEAHRSSDTINHLILLTDGQTYGDEQGCLEQSELAARGNMTFNTMGIGSDWNEDLLDQMAATTGGTSTYIDSPRKVVDVFRETMQSLGSVIARDITLSINPANDVELYEMFQIAPEIRRMRIEEETTLGPLSTGGSKAILMEFRLSNLEAGERNLMQITVTGDLPTISDRRSWERAETTIEAVPETEEVQLYIPPPIITALGKLAIFKMQEKAMSDLESGNISAATQRLETMATRLLNLGETDLARAALLEAGRLARTGDLSAEGRKKIRYGTRGLSILPKEIRHD